MRRSSASSILALCHLSYSSRSGFCVLFFCFGLYLAGFYWFYWFYWVYWFYWAPCGLLLRKG